MMKFIVLIIDDKKSIREVFSQLFLDMNYIVETAEKGIKGIKIAQGFRPDVTILDMNLSRCFWHRGYIEN